jgi:hypothetical protein
MRKLPAADTTEILTGVHELKAGIATLASEVHLHGEILARIVQLLTPSDEQSGPRLHELLAALIGRLDRQAIMLKEVLEAQRNLSRTLPREVAEALNNSVATDGPDASGATGGKPNGGNGRAASQS